MTNKSESINAANLVSFNFWKENEISHCNVTPSQWLVRTSLSAERGALSHTNQQKRVYAVTRSLSCRLPVSSVAIIG